jgi:signal peptidase I
MAEAKKTDQVKTTEEMVKFTAFKDDGRYKDDIFVSVNGKRYIIKRGEEVIIPKSVYEVLMNSQKQNQAAYRLMEEQADKFEAESQRYG